MTNSAETPDGFSYVANGEQCVIKHRRTGMVAMNIFLIVFLAFWSFFFVALTRLYCLQQAGVPTPNTDPIPMALPAILFIAVLVVAFFLAYSLLARKTFHVSKDELLIETTLLGLSWRWVIPRASIRSLRQIKDGGRSGRESTHPRDSFPSWGLMIRAREDRRPWIASGTGGERAILARLPYQHSEWLGDFLARWAGVEFTRCPR